MHDGVAAAAKLRDGYRGAHLRVVIATDLVFAGCAGGPGGAGTLLHVAGDVLAVDVGGVDGALAVLDEDGLANLDGHPGWHEREVLLVDFGDMVSVGGGAGRGGLRGGACLRLYL